MTLLGLAVYIQHSHNRIQELFIVFFFVKGKNSLLNSYSYNQQTSKVTTVE